MILPALPAAAAEPLPPARYYSSLLLPLFRHFSFQRFR
jgi:hypothetical protein